MDATGELAQLGDRLLDLVLCARQHVRVGRVTAGSREPERERERDEPLLRAVVEVALDPPLLGIGRGDDPRPRRPHLGELRAHLGRQTLVLEHEPGRRADGLHERRLVEQCRIVNERGDLLASCGHHRHRAIGASRQLDRPARRHRRSGRRRADTRARASGRRGRGRGGRARLVAPSVCELDDELGRLRSAQPRPDDPSDDPERDEQPERRGRSSPASARSRPSRLTHINHSTVDGNGEGGADEQRRLRASCGLRARRANDPRAGSALPERRRRPRAPALGRRRRPRSAAAQRRAGPASREATKAPTS